MTHEQCACKQLKTVVFGQRPDQTDGLLSIAMNSAQTLHGTNSTPGGIVKDVADIKSELSRWRWMLFGGFTVVNALILYGPKILQALHK